MPKISREEIVPYLRKGGKKVYLYTCEGRVYSIQDFVELEGSKLGKNEIKIILEQKRHLTSKTPKILRDPFTLSAFLKKSKEKICVERAGARSAYWKTKKIKFKGCRPEPGLAFPTEELGFGFAEVKTGKIPFGVLSTENVMREILAYCFFKQFKIAVCQKPLCVFEYLHEGKILGYCLALQKPTDERMENKLDYFGLSIKDLISIKYFEKKFKLKVLSGEVGFKGINPKWYVKQKSKILVSMNFNGGFRGILNSNIGNDILHKKRLCICDFDTFRVIKIPKKPSLKFMNGFCLWCLVELFKTSPLVWDYLDLEGKSKKEVLKMLQDSFFENSSLWKSYKERFFREAKKRNWNLDLLQKALSKASKTGVYYDMIPDTVVNSKLLRETYKPELSLYVSHNY